jgi:hypothetical protein
MEAHPESTSEENLNNIDVILLLERMREII